MRSLFLILLFISTGCASSSKSTVQRYPTAEELVGISTDQGIEIFQRSKSNVDFFLLANNFESQENGLFCGPTTAAIVLNSFRVRTGRAEVPKDTRATDAADRKFLPSGVDPHLARYTPNTVVDRSPKPRAEVFGKPRMVDGKSLQDFGFQLRQFAALLSAHALNVELRVADEKLSDEQIKQEIIDNLSRKGDFVIVNYKRSEVGQSGGGHISPLGAYDAASDRVLVMDVNPVKADWVWMPFSTLIKGMRSFDTVENRGYLLVSEK